MCTQKGAKSAFQGAKCDCIKKPLNGDIVLQLLSYVAETERDMIRQRQKEGIKAAIARGIHLGRPKRELDKSFFDALKAWKSGQMTCKQAAASCGMRLSNFRYHAGKV